jgi:sulfatase modifying factor 1
MKTYPRKLPLLPLALGLLLLTSAAQAAVSVSNVSAAQTPGTKEMVITYDVAASTPTVSVSLEVRDGDTVLPASSVSGHVGAGVATGAGRSIVWDAGADWNGNVATLTYTVTADDGVEEPPPAPAGMVLVEGGTLAMSMGTVTVDTFYMGIYEVTWGEWQEVRTYAAANGYDIGSVGAGCAADHPVHRVNWFDVLKWSNAKSEMEGLTPVYTVSGAVFKTGQPSHTSISQNLSASGYRLPLEAEWEFAARGGNHSTPTTYAGSNDLNAVGWYRDNSGGAACNLWNGLGTWPVGQKAANELGLYDMSGNVWEWCWDRWTDTSSIRVTRGGSWPSNASDCTVSSRYYITSSDRRSDHGFRLARSAG